ncbi:cation diffusion facilitator family transporter [Candidatus Laterigemmans baculatus]|uniref:cation diffusion facilitator family transporter n=1 Tax=Candidatus Laterigemmans baculatus TaxID=2770505 RepID=UPI0013DA9B44|nr:cation diffusion facilitator family transporter [Candidatus Laterigemmans baculatus]
MSSPPAGDPAAGDPGGGGRCEVSLANRRRVYRDATRAAGVGLAANVLLLVAKLAGGLFTGSAALLADAVNSLGDVASSLVVRGGLWVAQREEDEDHPYGHTKAESIAGLSVALLVTFSAVVLAVETLRQFTLHVAPPRSSAIWIAAACAVTKESLYHYTRRAAARLGSSALAAAAWDHRSDALSSAAIALALFVGYRLGPQGWAVDPLAALVMCLLLVYVGLKIYSRTAAELMDQQADATTVAAIETAAKGPREVCGVEKLRVRKSGLEFFVEIHVEVDGHLTVDEGHRVGHEVKDAVLRQFPRVRDVHVHIEPFHP